MYITGKTKIFVTLKIAIFVESNKSSDTRRAGDNYFQHQLYKVAGKSVVCSAEAENS